jgi:cytochrome c
MRFIRTVAAAWLAAGTLLSPSFGADLHSGDAARGEKIYDRCIACHSIDRDRTGPRHSGLVGRPVGGVPGFSYSPAMKAAGARGMVWDEPTLDRFLENPMRFLPGTRMGYAGVKNAQERADLIAFLKQAGANRQAQSR